MANKLSRHISSRTAAGLSSSGARQIRAEVYEMDAQTHLTTCTSVCESDRRTCDNTRNINLQTTPDRFMPP